MKSYNIADSKLHALVLTAFEVESLVFSPTGALHGLMEPLVHSLSACFSGPPSARDRARVRHMLTWDGLHTAVILGSSLFSHSNRALLISATFGFYPAHGIYYVWNVCKNTQKDAPRCAYASTLLLKVIQHHISHHGHPRPLGVPPRIGLHLDASSPCAQAAFKGYAKAGMSIVSAAPMGIPSHVLAAQPGRYIRMEKDCAR